MAGLRAPIWLPKGEYDAIDARGSLADLRGVNVGVMPGADGRGFAVTAVSGSSARVAVAGGRAWIPVTRSGVRVERHAALVELPTPGVEFPLAPSSPTGDRTDLIVTRLAADTDATPFAEVPLSGYVPGTLAAGWAVDVVQGIEGGAVPPVPFDSYLLLARVRVRRGATSLTAADIEDMRWSGQGDPTVLAPLRTAPGQSVSAAASSTSRGGLVYATDEDRMYVRTASDVRPLTYRPSLMPTATGKGSTGWWSADFPDGGDGRMLWWEGPAVPYARIGTLAYQMRWASPGGGRLGWTSVWIRSAGVMQYESPRVYSDGAGVHQGVAHVTVPAGQPLSVVAYLYGQGGWAQFDSWQSDGGLLLLPAE
ncbi:hypothetical protein [Kitasatospora sp. NPDC001527]|uniref:hypothetical protein n=1 Tax=Kitasatospora sp. NPDC001527 TaxID=3154519 RepID=UPI0033274C5F